MNGLLDRALSAIHHSALIPRRTTVSCGQKPYKLTAALLIADHGTDYWMDFVSKVLKKLNHFNYNTFHIGNHIVSYELIHNPFKQVQY